MIYDLRLKNRIYLFLSIIFCLVAWVSRLFELLNILQIGFLGDFQGYYQVIQLIIHQQITPDKLLSTSFGPPFVYLPFLLFSWMPFKLAEYIFSLINLFAYGVTFYFFWRKCNLKLNWMFWLLIGWMADCFPLIFSLGMGNPIGIVTLGIYSIWLFKKDWVKWLGMVFAVLLKIFPAVVIIPYLLNYSSIPPIINSNRKAGEKFSLFSSRSANWRSRTIIFILLIISFFILHIIFYPSNIWAVYVQSFIKLFNQGAQVIAVYNQSLPAVFGRWGINHNWYYLIAFLIIFYVVWLTRQTLNTSNHLIKLSLIYLSAVLLIQPISWQYYFAILLPYIMVQIGKRKWWYFVVLLLISLDGNRFSSFPVLGNFLLNSQFWGNLVFLGLTSRSLMKTSS